MTRARTSRAVGFTLIELLVVIAIISLLVSILLPSLGRAKDQARIVVCVANEGQIGLAFQYYLEDNRETFCSTCNPGGVDSYFWYIEGLHPYLPHPVGGSNEIFRCPGDPDPYVRSNNNLYVEGYGIRVQPLLSYGTNLRVCPYFFSVDPATWPSKIRRASDFEDPWRFCLLGETGGYYVGDWWYSSWEPRHGGETYIRNDAFPKWPSTTQYMVDETILYRSTINVAFVDGHADSRRWPLPCYPFQRQPDFRNY